MLSRQGIQSSRVVQLSQVRFTAQSKKNRIEIQLLKDFSGVGARGQIVKVKPSAMINKFHPNNGAVYLNYKDAKPAIPVVTKASINRDVEALEAKKRAKLEARALKEQLNSKANEKKIQKELKTLSLDEILSIDFNVLTQKELSLIFFNLPKNFVFVKKTEENALLSPIRTDDIKVHIQSILAKNIRQSDIILKFVNGKNTIIRFKDEQGTVLPENTISSVGNYYVEISNAENTSELPVTVNAASK